MTLNNCPIEFNNNCVNYIYKCNLCSGGLGHPSGALYYKPTNNKSPKKKEHPVLIEKEKQKKELNKEKLNSETYKKKSNEIKGGFKAEKNLTKEIAKQTLKSGSLLQNGDISLFNGDLNLDSKVRYNRSGFSLTKQEYEKRINNNIHGWIITNKQNSKEETVVILTIETFTKLLAYKQQIEKNYDFN